MHRCALLQMSARSRQLITHYYCSLLRLFIMMFKACSPSTEIPNSPAPNPVPQLHCSLAEFMKSYEDYFQNLATLPRALSNPGRKPQSMPGSN